MELLHQYWLPYTISNTIALVVLMLAWKIPSACRIGLGVIFLLASIVNVYTALTEPADYLDYRNFAALEIYRQFIDGWFTQHTAAMVLAIAVGQFLIGVGMFFGGHFLKPAIAGVIIFGIAVSPLGIGAAFPCTILLAIAAILLWPRQDSPA